MEIWILTYIFVMNGVEAPAIIPMTEDICRLTKMQLVTYKYKDKYPFQDVNCERNDGN